MSLDEIVEVFPWYRYSKKLQDRVLKPRNGGTFTKAESEERRVRLVEAEEGTVDEGNAVKLFWLVDKEEGTILDAKFQVFGQTALIGAAEAACEACIGKNYDQASRLTAELIDRELRDKQDKPAFPQETFPHLSLVLEAIAGAAAQCTDIALPTSYIAPPVPAQFGSSSGERYPGWEELPLKKKIAVIESVLDVDVRPYIALDAGGIEVINLLNDREVLISYQGSCTSCYSSVGTTLSYIQQTLKNKVHPDLVVTPDIEFESPYPI